MSESDQANSCSASKRSKMPFRNGRPKTPVLSANSMTLFAGARDWFFSTLLVVECVTSAATAYEHTSNAQWAIGRAFFPSLGLYVQSRLFHWALVLAGTWLLISLGRHLLGRRASGTVSNTLKLLAVGLLLELITTLISSGFPDRSIRVGLVFESFWLYLFSRLGVWFGVAWIVILGHRWKQATVSVH